MTLQENFKQRMNHIRCFVFDIDGVLTDGSLLITDDGAQLRRMNIKDGYALVQAVKKNYKVWIISGSISEGVRLRLNRLGIDEIHMQVENKWRKLEALLIEHKVSVTDVLYMGDDLPDLEVMTHCGIATAPADAVHEIKAVAHYVSEKKGGEGCVRDVIEQVLKVQKNWHVG